MKTAIDIILLLIIVLCIWNGYKQGVISGIAGIIVIVIAMFGGSLLSAAFSSEVIPALEPFVQGYSDSADTRKGILSDMGYSSSALSLDDILKQDSSLRYDYAYENMRHLGMSEERSDELAAKAVTLADSKGISLVDAIVDVQCDAVTYVGGLAIGFLLILITIMAFANLLNLSMRLPNLETLDEVGGAVLGFVKGIFYCVLLCWLLSFLGLLIGRSTLNETLLGKFFGAFTFITRNLM